MLSVIIITKNEALHIERCLRSIAWVDEIVVFDSGSTDATVDICKRFTDKVFVTDWPGFGIQKQRALDQASNEWVLSVDADEEVTPELRVALEQAMSMDQYHGFELARLSSYCGRRMMHGGWWPDYVLRLFRRSAGRFTEALVHERIIVDGAVGRIETPLLHEAFIDLNEVLHKVNSYSTLGAEQLLDKGVRSSLGKAVVRGAWTFFRTYFLKAAFLDGAQGFMLSVSNAEGAYYKYLKLYELQQRKYGR